MHGPPRRLPSGDELQRLQEALLDAYSFVDLKQMARIQLETDLLRIVPFVDQNLEGMVHSLIMRFATRQGGLHQLVVAARKGNSTNRALSLVADELLSVNFDPLPGIDQRESIIDLISDLPEPVDFDLPDAPYRSILWFRRQDAPIFFGRGSEIRDLFRRITASRGDSIILYYGQSGVGKTSLLEAGLIPRLEHVQIVSYARRDQALGLAGTLADAISLSGHVEDPHQYRLHWLAIEANEDKPLTVILDQIEEVYTRPADHQADEIRAFLDVLDAIFYQPETRPKGRLVLSFRKEWLAEIETRLAERKLYAERVFVERLSKRGVVEAILGPIVVDRLRRRYNLTIEDDLAGEIADDLLADSSSAIAPTLQILLDRMWYVAKQADYGHPVFKHSLYDKLRRKGYLLAHFLDQQLANLATTRPDWVKSGFVLDLLAFHTTPFGTAEQRTLPELQQTYTQQSESLKDLLTKLHSLYLLVEPPGTTCNVEPISRLAHDTLAPIVRMRFDESDTIGQRARRVLEGRMASWHPGEATPTMDDLDLAVVLRGRDGMRDWTQDEAQLVERSQHEQQRREAIARRVQQELEDAKQREIEQQKEITRQSRARIRQQKWIIRVLSFIVILIALWGGIRLYESLFFHFSDWDKIAGDNFPDESIAYAIDYASSERSSSGFLYCVATWMVGVGCSENGETWNFYQQGLPTGSAAPSDVGGFSGNMRGLTALAFSNDEPSIMHTFALDGYFYSSDDWGQSWESSIDLLPEGLEVTRIIAAGTRVIALARALRGGGNERLYVSEDGGKKWSLVIGLDQLPIGRVYDAALDLQSGVITVATSTGIWQGIRNESEWAWHNSGSSLDTRLLERSPDMSDNWAYITFDSTTGVSTLWQGSLSDPVVAAEWTGEPLRMTVTPPGMDDAGKISPSMYVLLTDGTVIGVDQGNTVHLKGISHPIFGQSYAIAVVPRPGAEGLWLLLGHRSGLMLSSHELQ
jgi:hypothetical protein